MLLSIISTADFSSFALAVLACFVVLLGHAGFALYETGLSRAQNASNAMAVNALLWPLCAIAFFATGFAFLCGGALPPGRWLIHFGNWNVLSGKGFFLSGGAKSSAGALLFLVMMSRVTIAATIPSGALAERWRFKSFFVFSLITGGLIIPIFGSWVWGGGWISQLRWGHGGIDYAGSAVIHMLGGMIALACAWLLGPRLGKFDPRGRPRPILGHHIPMAVLGCLIIAISLLALNALPSLTVNDGRIVAVALNSILAAGAGAMAASLYMSRIFGKPDPTVTCNGMLAGLVAIAAPCAFVQPWAAVLIGAVAGILTIWSISFWESRGIDDPGGVISVHGAGGLWGVLAPGLFADSTFDHVAGLFYGDSHQFISQCVMAGACLAWGLIVGGLAFSFVGRFFGPNRVTRQIESSGLDISEVGVPAYQELLNPISSALAAEPRPASSPTSGGKARFSVVVEGVDSASLIRTWSSLCQVSTEPPCAEFKQVYPYLTTITGNRFRFRGGDPTQIKDNLRRLIENSADGKSVSTRIEA